ncbi:MAG: serine/threonine protein kinase, partial [Planctomycetes bacterium]|nr:serine/threonine protein kinase [Planctomycetota bacterium]
MSSSSLPESGFPPRDSFEETQGADSRPQGPWASSQRGSDARAPVPPPPFPGRDSVEETQGGDSRLAGSWASSRTSADRQQVGPYTVLRELGRGSWGVVFLGSKPGEAPVAIKLLLEKGQADPEARARFEREAELAARIRHPGIVPLLRAGQEARGMYYAMEYVPGPTLKDHFAQRGRLLPEEACELVATLAEALEAAHLQGVVHRDVKPANVILEAKTGRPRLADFGLARDTLRGSNLTQTRDVIGTPAYMAPEQFSGARVDARADVYALGVILYQALLGRLPYKADNVVALQHQVLRGGYPSPLALRPDLPPALEPILARALARDPAQRFQSAGELADALSQDLERPEALYLPPLEQTAHKRPRWFMSLALGLLCGAPLHLLLREDVADPVLEAQPPLEAPPPAEQLREVFTLAGRGLPYTSLAWRLDQLELYSTERTAAQVALAFRRGRLRKTMRLAEGLPHDDASPLVQEARLQAGLAATFLAEYRIATATLEPLTLTAEPYADVARAWMCLADDY